MMNKKLVSNFSVKSSSDISWKCRINALMHYDHAKQIIKVKSKEKTMRVKALSSE